MNNNLDPRFCITNFKEMYESNNNLLIRLVQNSNTISISNSNTLIEYTINANNEIMRNITNLLNHNNNLNTNNRQQNAFRHQNNRQQSNRQHRNNDSNNAIYRATDAVITNMISNFLEPIEIYPTLSQIESATRVARYGDIVSPLNTACPISLENFNEDDRVLIIRHCNHIFSNNSLISWFRSNCRCPVCRYDIRNYPSEYPNNTTDISGNLIVSSNILPSIVRNVERRNQSTPANILADILYMSIPDSNSNSSNNNNNSINTTDLSGNLLRLFFRPE